MALLTLVPPASEPVTVAQLKQFARVDFPDDDALWPSFLASARQWCEVFCQRRFILQTMRLLMDFFPGYIDFKLAGQKVSSPFVSGSNAVLVGIRYAIALPYPRVRAVINFQFQDANGNVQQMTVGTLSGQYNKDLSSQPARLTPPFGQMWPVARVIPNAVQVDYVTGYGGNVTVSMTNGQKALAGITVPQDYVGMPISIPGAGAAAGALQTTIAAVDSSGVATTADAAAAAVVNVTAYIGDPVPEAVQVAILRYATAAYEGRSSAIDPALLDDIRRMLTPYRDLRL